MKLPRDIVFEIQAYLEKAEELLGESYLGDPYEGSIKPEYVSQAQDHLEAAWSLLEENKEDQK